MFDWAIWVIEKALDAALGGLGSLALKLLAKAAVLIALKAPRKVREVMAQKLMKLADVAMDLVNRALDFVKSSDSPVGKQVAKAAREIADKLYEMARQLTEDSPSMVQMENETDDAEVLARTYEVDADAIKNEIEKVEHEVKVVVRMLKEDAEIEGAEAGDNHPHEGDEKK